MREKRLRQISMVLSNWLESGKESRLAGYLQRLHSADIAEMCKFIGHKEKLRVFDFLPPEKIAWVLSEMESVVRQDILKEMDVHLLSTVIGSMPSDDAADLIADVPDEKAEEVLSSINREESEEVQKLLEYAPDSAGGIMTVDFVSVPENITAGETINRMREMEPNEPIYNVFVVDEYQRLAGILTLDTLVRAPAEKPISDIMNKDFEKVTPYEDQEEVSEIVKKYDLNALPVVDEDGHLLGRITVDDVIDVIEEEATEDILKMVGTNEEELLRKSVFQIAGIRLPWLFVTLAGELLTCGLLVSFSKTLTQAIALVFFVPIIMAIGGNIGIQSSTIVVRGLATGSIDFSLLWKVLFREMRVGMIMGVTCSVVVGTVAHFIGDTPFLGIIVAVSMFFAITTAAMTGTLVPLLFKRFHIDPAIASGPFITTSNDITGLLIYFALSTLLLNHIS